MMSVFKRELKSNRKSLFFWLVGMITLIGTGMIESSAYQGAGKSINELMEKFPQSIRTIFGLDGFDLSTASGYYGLLFIYIALIAASHAVLTGANIISKEERDRTSEFLFVKPISRFKIVFSKMMAGLMNVLIMNIVTLASSLCFVNYFNKGAPFIDDVLILMLGLLITQIIFFFVGTVVAAICKAPRLSSPIATAIILVAFILTFLVNINEKIDFLKYLTPFKYFEAKELMSGGRFEIEYLAISAVIIVILIGVTFISYLRRDLKV